MSENIGVSDDRYLYCETITGEWWYKDMKTGEDLPLYSTPIRGREEDIKVSKDNNSFEDMINFIKEVYENAIQEPSLEEELEKERNIINKIKGSDKE